MSASQIRAGQAFVEVMAKDKTNDGLNRAQNRLKMFAASVKALNHALAQGLQKAAGLFEKIGRSLVVAGGSITAVMAKAVSTFLDVSQQAKAMGKAIAGLDPAKAERLSNAWENLKAVGSVILFRLGEALAAPLTSLFEALAAIGMQIANFIKNNQQLVVIVAAVGAAALAAGLAFLAFGKIIGIAAASLSVLGVVIPLLASPLGVAAVAVAALAAALLLTAGAFIAFSEAGRDSVTGIVAAIATGDILTAWGIITKGMEVAWQGAMISIRGMFSSLSDFILTETASMARRIQTVLGAIGAGTKVVAQKNPSLVTGGTSVAAQIGAGAAGRVAAAAETSKAVKNAGEQQQQSESAAALAKSMAELAAINERARKEAVDKLGLAGVSVNLPNIAAGLETNSRQRLGVTGTFSSTAAGQNRALGGIEKEQKKSNEHLDRVVKLLGEIKAEGGVEFAQ